MKRCAATAVTLVLLASCTSAPAGRTLTVLAASSLTEAFTEVARQVEAANPGLRVRLTFGPSSTLVTQAGNGAPYDVIAVADRTALDPLRGTVSEPVTIAHNRLAIAVPPGNPAGVRDIRDLARPNAAVVVCAPAVPCGRAAGALFAANGVTVHPVSEERDVKAVLTKVQLREADAGLVYRSDISAAGTSVTGISAARDEASRTDVLVATRNSSADARAFIAHLTATDGRETLAAAGFELP